MITAEIKNWKEVQKQFGFETAKKISRLLSIELRRIVEQEVYESVDHLTVPCSENSEAIALFELTRKLDNQFIYEYTGTAN